MNSQVILMAVLTIYFTIGSDVTRALSLPGLDRNALKSDILMDLLQEIADEGEQSEAEATVSRSSVSN